MANRSLKIRDANLAAPPATGQATEWVVKMGRSIMDAVTPDDVGAILKGLVDKAKAGDEKAAKQVLDFVGKIQPLGRTGPSPRPEDTVPNNLGEIHVDCAVVLGKDGPLPPSELAKRAGYSVQEIAEAIAPRPGVPAVLFDVDGKGFYRLTSIGRRELLNERHVEVTNGH